MIHGKSAFCSFLCLCLCIWSGGTISGGVSERPDSDDPPSESVLEQEPELDLRSERQFKTAEMADAVLGTELSRTGIQALIPEGLKGSLFGTLEQCDGENCDSESEDQSKDKEQSTDWIENLEPESGEEQNTTESTKTYKISCDKRNTGTQNPTVQVLNASQDLMEFLSVNGSECSLVLFYTAWCRFSASLAPHFNALPRGFPSMHFLALDASQHSSLSTRFGTVAVPNVLLFQGAKPVARFNHTERTLLTLTAFITNHTGLEVVPDVMVTEDDHFGPLPSIPQKSIDWLFVFSVLFILGFTFYAILRTDSIRLLIPGQEHDHQE
ncbi:thioredoxin domain-containing protein 15 [Hoplias malabaricus]|uniref:thioredoxin domain-containing protein 15 n=1 Tax=Hoplias malabaricus TaxID=27720 RepID=UPI003462B836